MSYPSWSFTCLSCIGKVGGDCIGFGLGLVFLGNVGEGGVVDIEVFLEGEPDDCMRADLQFRAGGETFCGASGSVLVSSAPEDSMP